MLQQNLFGNIYVGAQWIFFCPRVTREVNVLTGCRIFAALFLFSEIFRSASVTFGFPLSHMNAMNIFSSLLWDNLDSVFAVAAFLVYKDKYLPILWTLLFFTCTLSVNIDRLMNKAMCAHLCSLLLKVHLFHKLHLSHKTKKFQFRKE